MEPIDIPALKEDHEKWINLINTLHHGSNHRTNPERVLAPLKKPLSESTMALVTTAGAHLASQEPFHVETVAGDQTWRVLPHGLDPTELRFTHTHYDTEPAGIDHNVVLPIERLNEAVAAGRIGAAAPAHIGMMGFNPDPTEIADTAAPQVADFLIEQGTDVVMLVPG